MEENEESRGYYPGSRVPLPTGTAKPAAKKQVKRELVTWDSRPTRKVLGGKYVDLFPVGALAASLGRESVTIRLWIRKGYLPPAPLRMPDKNGVKGRRLYTREQIEAIIKVAEKHKIRDAGRVQWAQHPTFADEVRQAWAYLK